jgi:L-alanine-DL-glutamate epimerase-like enolase superfamily enzyme
MYFICRKKMSEVKAKLNWGILEKDLQLRYTWKISRNSSAFKTNFFISTGDGLHNGMGEVAPNIRYGETPGLIREQFSTFMESFASEIMEPLQLASQLKDAGFCNSLRFGIESAFVHYLCNSRGLTVYEYLGLGKPAPVPTFYSLPIMDPAELAPFVKKHGLQRFRHLKVKINNENGLDLVNEAAKLASGPLAIDANEAWTDPDKLLGFCEKLKRIDVLFMEQPMPAAMQKEYAYLKPLSPFSLMADESVTDDPDFKQLSSCFHGVNMKLMKAGGYINGLRIMQETRRHGMKAMIGCMVETSLGISSALHLCSLADHADLDGFLILQEDPFGLAVEQEGFLSLS